MLGVPSHVIAKVWLTVIGLFLFVVAVALFFDSASQQTTTRPQTAVSFQQTPKSDPLVDLSTNADVLRDVSVVSSVFSHRTLGDDYRTWNISISTVRIRDRSSN
jgi:hypothetical protein